MSRPVVAVPRNLLSFLTGLHADLVAWSGDTAPPRQDVTVWVPEYNVRTGWVAADSSVFSWLPELRVVQLLVMVSSRGTDWYRST